MEYYPPYDDIFVYRAISLMFADYDALKLIATVYQGGKVGHEDHTVSSCSTWTERIFFR